MTNTLRVSEVYGPTLQGEGPSAGRLAWFTRLAGCNLACTWCDTPYTWDGSRYNLPAETTHLPAAEITARLGDSGIVIITGGEPLLQQHQPAFLELLERIHTQQRPVHVETNGTLAPTPRVAELVDLFTVSPKLSNAGPHRGHQNPALHPTWADTPNTALKVVCATTADVATAANLAAHAGIPPDRTWVMPEGTTPDHLAARWPAIATAATRHGLNATHRLHILAWGDERGH